MRALLRSIQRDERGVSAMEYAVLAGIVVVAVVAAGSLLNNGTTGLPGLFKNLLTTINKAGTPPAGA
ncbi:Flp family type IVb pilin [Trinickia fusca]|uniref:Flp family type IVb pilin n=1 Tax=Trinickia fusca TaxID=2419777 RepID=A0A494XJ46_9BURK|nr:Flp family type IVb pilin [Trinickia fusca]RKP50608.1 Flp family type IVb pilin [Trinickia fusca]